MLKDRADVSIMNNRAENFLSLLKRMPDEWFEKVGKEKDVLDFFIEQKDDPDSHLETIFKRLRKIWLSKKQGCPHKIDGSPIELSEKIFHQRHLFKKSFDELIAWHGQCHAYKLKDIRECYFKYSDHDKAFILFDQSESIIKKPLTMDFYMKNWVD